jgi:hypothetical protein
MATVVDLYQRFKEEINQQQQQQQQEHQRPGEGLPASEST